MKFNEFVKSSIKASGLKRYQIAAILNISTVTLWRWERGICKPEDKFIEFWKKEMEKIYDKNLH